MPNILLIMSDQMRYDAMEANGNNIIKTPNLNRLALSGVNFRNAFSPNPICVPARASLTTGCYSHKCNGGVKDNGGIIREGFPLLGDELNKRGYETYAVGKLHYLPYRDRENRVTHGIRHVELAESGRMVKKLGKSGSISGIEDYLDYLHEVGWGGYSRGNCLGNNDIFPSVSVLPEEFHVDKWVADRAIYYLENHLRENPQKPFFMWASFPKPHSPYDPPRPYDSIYDPRQIPPPTGDIDLIIDRGLDLLYKDHIKYMWDLISPEGQRVIKARYYGLVSFQDRQIGRLLDFLDDKRITGNTIVVYTSDHGDMLGDFGLYFKRTFYNSSVKIPFIISYPGVIPAGRVTYELAGLQDIMPTLMALAGTPLAVDVDGVDLSPVLFENKPVRDYYVSQTNNGSHRLPKQRYMIADKKWKYIYHQYGGVEELYNETDDQYELENLAYRDDVREIKAQLREKLKNWCIENDDTQMIENGDLICTPKSEEQRLPDTRYKFGRRFY